MRVFLPARALSFAMTGCLLAGATVPAAADDWQFNPRVQLGGEYDDNLRLLASPNQDRMYGFFTNAQMQFRYLSPVDDVSITPAVYGIVSPDSSVNDTADPSVVFNWNRTAQTYKAGLFAEYIDQSIVEANETNAANLGNQLGNPTPGDTGRIGTEKERRALTDIAPTFTWDFTQRQHLQGGLEYDNVTFNKDLPGFSVGYNSVNGNLGVVQDLTQRTSVAVRAIASRYEPQQNFPAATGVGGTGEWDYHSSQISQMYVRAGAERTTFQAAVGTAAAVVTNTPPTTSVLAGAGMNWTFQVTQVFIDLTRTIEPNGTGFTVDRDQARVSVVRQLSPRFTAEIGGRLDRDTPTSTTLLFQDRTYGLAYLTGKWRFLRDWTLAGEYDFTYQKFGSLPGAAAVPATATSPAIAATAPTNAVNERSNAVLLSVIWEPKPRN